MIVTGQIVRDRTRSMFKIGIVIGSSNRAGKVRRRVRDERLPPARSRRHD
jgi:hypothetical protein